MQDTCACGATFTRDPAKDPFQWQCDRCVAERVVKSGRRQADRLTPDRLDQSLDRARAAGAPATLTMREWLAAVRFFDGLCAYCGEAEYAVIEHATPIPRGGTTAGNCLPACVGCNNRMGARDLATWAVEEPSPRKAAALA